MMAATNVLTCNSMVSPKDMMQLAHEWTKHIADVVDRQVKEYGHQLSTAIRMNDSAGEKLEQNGEDSIEELVTEMTVCSTADDPISEITVERLLTLKADDLRDMATRASIDIKDMDKPNVTAAIIRHKNKQIITGKLTEYRMKAFVTLQLEEVKRFNQAKKETIQIIISCTSNTLQSTLQIDRTFREAMKKGEILLVLNMIKKLYFLRGNKDTLITEPEHVKLMILTVLHELKQNEEESSDDYFQRSKSFAAMAKDLDVHVEEKVVVKHYFSGLSTTGISK